MNSMRIPFHAFRRGAGAGRQPAPGGKPGRYRAAVLSRLLAAGAGGYALAYVVAVASARWLPLSPADVVLASTMLGFLALAIAAIVVFACASAWRAWGWIAGASLLFFALAQCYPEASA